jgi:hypothetical protein
MKIPIEKNCTGEKEKCAKLDYGDNFYNHKIMHEN